MILSVASGKGGTGKTLVATSLALSVKDRGNLSFLDCDVEEPNAHLFLKPDFRSQETVSISVPSVIEDICTHCGKCAEVCAYNCLAVLKDRVMVFPELCHGCGACSYLCPEKAITEAGRPVGQVDVGHVQGIDFVRGTLNVGEAMAPPVIKKVKEHIDPARDTIIDVPPGTSCPVVESVRGSHFCLLVTEPTPFGLNDLALAVDMVRELGIPCGVVLNRAGVGDTGTQDYCRSQGVPILMEIPLDREIARLYSQGVTLVEGMPAWRQAFIDLYSEIQRLATPEAVP